MPNTHEDNRSTERRKLDDAIAAEPELKPLDLPADVVPRPLEAHLQQLSRPLAVPGIVENGMIRLLDSSVNLPEQSRVIVVAADPS